MVGYGFGTRSLTRHHMYAGLVRRRELPGIAPSPGWTGDAGSGFGGEFAPVPVDPVRTTAKPAMQLIVPPLQAFTDRLLVGVYAGANNRGSLLDKMGLENVTAHYEGASIALEEPSFHTFADANGDNVTYWGWWLWLEHNGTNGLADLYFEAVPKDPALQRRVTGPHTFLPSPSLYDFDLAVAPSQPVAEGTSYQSITAALAYLRASEARHPRICIMEAYEGDIANPVSAYTGGQGYLTIEADTPVTFCKTAETKGVLRLNYSNVRWRGANITFDMRHISTVDPYAKGACQFDGVNFVNSGGRDELWNKSTRPAAYLSSSQYGVSPWFSECRMSDTMNSAMQSASVRGCRFDRVAGDLATSCRLLLGCTIHDMDSSAYRVEYDALTIHYTGPGASATIAISGTLNANSRTITARVDGAVVSTFTVGKTNADFVAGTNYDVSDVADWLNSLAGWTATVLDDRRVATALGPRNTNGNWNLGNADVKSAPLTLVTQFDLHPDIMQRTGQDENVVIADNVGHQLVAQDVFFNLYPLKDVLVLNNAFSQKEADAADYYSQLSSNQSHVVVAHNTLSSQALMVRPGNGYAGDAFCLIANNALAGLSDEGGSANIAIRGNHVPDGASVAGEDGSIGGERATLYSDEGAGDFAPQGALLANLKPPVLAYGRNRSPRGARAPAGAFV